MINKLVSVHNVRFFRYTLVHPLASCEWVLHYALAFLFIINVFVVMWQDAKEIITRRMRAIAGSFTFRHCLCPHKQSVHIICSKRDCKSFVKTQTKAVRFSKLRMP